MWELAMCRRNSLLLALLALLAAPLRASEEPWLGPDDFSRMADYGMLYEDSPYHFGARRPSSEDCSSLIQKVFSLMGIELPRSSREQAMDERFREVPVEEMRAGDLVFFRNTWRRGVSHVAYLLGPGRMLHASPRHRRVRLSPFGPTHPLWRKIHSVRRWRRTVEADPSRPRFSWDDKV